MIRISQPQAQAGLRDQLAQRFQYFCVNEPMGSALVAARNVSEARDTYFEAVKDELWGDVENPDAIRPYTKSDIGVRLADPDDLATLRSILPKQLPRQPTVLNEDIMIRLDAQSLNVRPPRTGANLRPSVSFSP